VYNTPELLAMIDEHRGAVLALCALAMIGNYLFFIEAYRVSRREKIFAIPIFCTMFWFALVLTVTFESIYLGQVIRYGGQELLPDVRDPILKARAKLERKETLGEEDEGKFLDAYSKLASSVAPVTAATLEATSPGRGHSGWLASLFGLRPGSDAQRLVTYFGILAVALIGSIAVGEWTLTFIRAIAVAEKQLVTNAHDAHEAAVRLESIEDQIEKLKPSANERPDSAAVRQALETRKNEAQAKQWDLDQANSQLVDIIDQGYAALGRVLFIKSEKLPYVAGPLGIVFGSFLLPVLYGALGTCAFVLRSLFREMVDRSFDRRRTGEFTVRIFLGMVSGLSLQWLVVRADGTVAGGVTPAVLAFLGGYSVEMLFAAMDRLVQLVTGRMRTSNRPGQPAARSKQDPTPEGPVAPRHGPTPKGPLGPKRGPTSEGPATSKRQRGRKIPVDDVPRAA